jgi:hypothetical protein
MKSVNTSTKRLTRTPDEDEESQFEFHITGMIEPGTGDRSPRLKIGNVSVHPVEDEEEPEEELEDIDEDDEPVVRINKLRRKENGDTDRSIVKKKRRQNDDGDGEDDEDESRGLYDTDPDLDDTEDLPDDAEDDDGDETIMSCIQRSMVSRRR